MVAKALWFDSLYRIPASHPDIHPRICRCSVCHGQHDHRFFKEHHGYDFPHRNWRIRLKNGLLLLLVKIPRIREKIYRQRIKGEMIKSLQRVVDEA